jgi:hypothetical protein
MKLFWPITIFLSVVAAGLVNFIVPDFAGRPFIMVWFLFICPGMVLARFFRFKEPVVEWSFVITLSLIVDTVIVGIQLYSGHWSPSFGLVIIMGICVTGTIIHLMQNAMKSTY